jgi:putative chitinase
VTVALANVLNESAAMTRVEEDLDYTSAAHLQAVFPSHFPSVATAQPFVNDPSGLAAKVYNGWQGRGLAMLTGLPNYAAYAKAKGMPLGSIAAYLLTPEGAADSAAWFFVQAGCTSPGNRGDLLTVTRRWEGCKAGAYPIGWADVQTWYGQVKRAMGSPVAAAIHAGGAPSVKPPVPAPKPQDEADALDDEYNPTTPMQTGDA